MRTYLQDYYISRGLKRVKQLKLTFTDIQGNSLCSDEALDLVMAGGIVLLPDYLDNFKETIGVLEFSDKCQRRMLRALELNSKKTAKQIAKIILKSRKSNKVLGYQTQLLGTLASSFADTFYLEMEPNLRFQLPYKKVHRFQAAIEGIVGPGQVTPHGAHKDSWFKHPKNTLNLWVPLSKTTPKNGLFILPKSQDYYPRFEGQEIANDVETYIEDQWETDLERGTAVLFLAELLHGSIINQTQSQTRSTLSMRFCLEAPNAQAEMYDYRKVEMVNGNYQFADFVPEASFDPLDYCRDTFKPAVFNQIRQPRRIEENKIIIEGKSPNQEIHFPRRCPHAGYDLSKACFDAKSNQLICPLHHVAVKGKNHKV